MREIKVRIWNKLDKVFSYATIGRDTINSFSNAYEANEFTGLHDKNGKDVYEGDVLGIANEQIIAEPRRWTVRWNTTDYSAYFDFGTMSRIDMFCEIIGNIYESEEPNA